MSDSAKTILLCGVGGQGTILAADLLARAAIASGDDVKLSEIHGMAQRGGAVTTVVRVGRAVGTMVADIGDADFLISFETTEALRNIAYLKQDGIAIVSDETIKPLTALTGRVPMPRGARKTLSGFGALVTPAELLARQAGSVKSVNVVLLGVLSTFLDYDEAVWLDVIRGRVPERFVDMNLKAFSLGRSFARDRAGQMG
ncbi:indolepyruvate oxidoreductase subunit beta [Slackia exigua]|uniref:Indolepyruvate ferredoxin oxidoreductase, beta subunit n=1 Tax=Slackia exigua (strain ATCC 700122 / DSM 15923 / CIP 105133 / JCM 11022 / KCTC 5966 / S-7) TaxID=649764 RepID=D0WEE7_SLAES|nr:indolepyruvate oxidoreductase subunit beta [Slackia exigua]MDU6010579.1 indolepyruvate oxidoreductase subunit beta [Slackia sp.]EEZ62085.1 putative indolepyruvate ferredoxin oxidoreductase, beta subunit [Slackia exigua ATCC 700122]MDK7723710.1 indolepyruvate oxidoreductase subunit beta [Slackia exigua]MDK7725876.1 indolepyruvate oxidoreductase subunit beta [Slackia exigua]STN98564.1 indolepyruvate oxidoreductase subunit beta [Slackia exigua]